MNIELGRNFGCALCKHFGLDAGSVASGMEIVTDYDEIFSVKLTIALTPDDLAAIAEIMKTENQNAG